jgi:hypothetical protein
LAEPATGAISVALTVHQLAWQVGMSVHTPITSFSADLYLSDWYNMQLYSATGNLNPWLLDHETDFG